MPLLVRFSATEIAMSQVRIDTLEAINISGRIDLREALEWAAANRGLLMAKWAEYSGDGA